MLFMHNYILTQIAFAMKMGMPFLLGNLKWDGILLGNFGMGVPFSLVLMGGA